MSAVAFAAAIAATGVSILLGAILPIRYRVIAASLGSSLACLLAFVSALQVLVSGEAWHVRSAYVLPFTGINLSLDPLGAVFVATTALVGFSSSCYAIGYSSHSGRSRTQSAMLPAFLATLLLVPAAASVATFMVAWELMALTSLLLLMSDHQKRSQTRDAVQWYATMTHIGAAAILFALILLAVNARGETFSFIALHNQHMSTTLRSVIFIVALVGFSSKAGAVPFHVWLPRAHPEAPSPVSALMSGAMVNLGVYGIIRLAVLLGGRGELWWWLVVVALGTLSAFFGALHASAGTDMKRLLAYSTIDNLGLVLIGVGVGEALFLGGFPLFGELALFAALFHIVNHSVFKGTLFLGAGAVQYSTGTRDLDELGGIVRNMPLTTFLFGIGALSIAALPGFNGFISEWLLFQGILHGFGDHVAPTVVALLFGVSALALTGGLSAAAFVKAFGVGFLGQPRTSAAANAKEVAPSMIVGMALLAVLCVGLGVVPGIAVPLLTRAANASLGRGSFGAIKAGQGLSLSHASGAIDPVVFMSGLLGVLGVIWLATTIIGRAFKFPHARNTEAWGCGREIQTARMEYTATSFAEPLQRVFSDVLRPDRDLETTHVAESRYFPKAIRYHSRVDDAIERLIYRRVINGVSAWGNVARRVPNGSVHRYLAFGFVALVLILVVLA